MTAQADGLREIFDVLLKRCGWTFGQLVDASGVEPQLAMRIYRTDTFADLNFAFAVDALLNAIPVDGGALEALRYAMESQRRYQSERQAIFQQAKSLADLACTTENAMAEIRHRVEQQVEKYCRSVDSRILESLLILNCRRLKQEIFFSLQELEKITQGLEPSVNTSVGETGTTNDHVGQAST